MSNFNFEFRFFNDFIKWCPANMGIWEYVLEQDNFHLEYLNSWKTLLRFRETKVDANSRDLAYQEMDNLKHVAITPLIFLMMKGTHIHTFHSQI